MVIDGSTATRASFTLNVASVATSEDERSVTRSDRAWRRRSGHWKTRYRSAVGTLTVRGVTRMVTAQLSGEYSGNSICVFADIPITYAAWNI